MLDEAVKQSFEFRVFPDQEPPVEGILIDADNVATTVFVIPFGTTVTVRASEMNDPRGFAWKVPDVSTLDPACAWVTNENFGDFNAGYHQILGQVGTAACTTHFTIERSDWYKAAYPQSTHSYDISISAGDATTTPCPSGE
jgi:hypothetical protein